MNEPTGQGESLRISTPDRSLTAEFRWHHDRFAHRLWLGDSVVGRSVVGRSVVGRSVEGNGDQPWPPSPPIQQLSCEEINGGRVLLGVGAAGRGHWSLSVESLLVDEIPALKFDIACQTKDRTLQLGSRYQLDSPLCIEPSDSTRIERTNAHCQVRPLINSAGTTHRWCYLISKC